MIPSGVAEVEKGLPAATSDGTAPPISSGQESLQDNHRQEKVEAPKVPLKTEKAVLIRTSATHLILYELRV